jgi:hypothetical protein
VATPAERRSLADEASSENAEHPVRSVCARLARGAISPWCVQLGLEATHASAPSVAPGAATPGKRGRSTGASLSAVARIEAGAAGAAVASCSAVSDQPAAAARPALAA